MSTRDIHDQIQDLYGIELLVDMVSKITEILPEVKEWQLRPLRPVYPFVFMDAIHKIRGDGRITNRATYSFCFVKLTKTINITNIYYFINKKEFFISKHCVVFVLLWFARSMFL
jgi:putative transposase